MKFTSHYLNNNAKRFDNYVCVVFISGLYKTEGDVHYKDYNGANSNSRWGDRWLIKLKYTSIKSGRQLFTWTTIRRLFRHANTLVKSIKKIKSCKEGTCVIVQCAVDLMVSRDEHVLPINKQRDNDSTQVNPLHLLQFRASCLLPFCISFKDWLTNLIGHTRIFVLTQLVVRNCTRPFCGGGAGSRDLAH